MSRLLRIAQAVDIPVVIVHTTNAAAMKEIEAARKRGQKVYVETCPQYLILDDSVYYNPSFIEAAKSKGDDVLMMDGQLDPHFISRLEQKSEGKARYTRVDADVIDKLIMKEDMKHFLLNLQI